MRNTYVGISDKKMMKQMLASSLNVKLFGAKGDGKTDDTQAIQNALDEASQAVLTRQDTDDISYPEGIPARCGYHYHSTGPEVFFPSGHYLISSPLLPRKTLALRGEGHPWIEQKDDTQDIVYGEESIRQSFDGLAFHGGRMHLNLGNRNEDNGQVRIEDCKFYGSKSVAIQMRKGSASTMLLVLRCQIVGCEQAVISWTDFTHIREGWLTGGCSGDGAQIVCPHIGCELTISNLCTVPMVNGGDQRWIDNYGRLVCRSVRFGGEEAGFTAVVNFARHEPQGLGALVVLDGCSPVCSLGNAKRPCAVYCEEIPNMIGILNCALHGIPPVMVSDQIDPNTYFKAKPGMLSYRFEGNVGEFRDCIPAALLQPLLNPPDGPRSLSDSDTLEALERAKSDWLARKATLEVAPAMEYMGHVHRTESLDYVDIAPDPQRWDVADHMDGTTDKNSLYYAITSVDGDILVMRRGIDGWPHIIIRDVEIDLDVFPYLTWNMIPTGSPASLTVRVLDKASGRSLSVERSEGESAGFRAYNIRTLLNSGGKHTLDMKLYYHGVRWENGMRINPQYAKEGDYIVIPFLRMEK